MERQLFGDLSPPHSHTESKEALEPDRCQKSPAVRSFFFWLSYFLFINPFSFYTVSHVKMLKISVLRMMHTNLSPLLKLQPPSHDVSISFYFLNCNLCRYTHISY